jgi:hypothetical protein
MKGPLIADAWNKLVDRRRKNRIISITSLNGSAWQHPWTVSPIWDSASQQWRASIKPGFVNGLAATVNMPDDAGEVPLTHQPQIPLSSWRSIGPDAAPDGFDASGDGARFTFEAVPRYFTALGVGAAPQIGGTDSIIKSISGTLSDQVRLLRAMDIMLYQDRPATASTFQQSNGTDSTIFQFGVDTITGPNARKRAYIRLLSKYTPPPPVTDPLARLMGDWSDPTRDELLLATVWMVSPLGAEYYQTPDVSWTPYLQHRVFWNLNHAAKRLPPPLKSENLSLNTGLALGTGDRVNEFLLSLVNDANSALAQFIGRNTIEGRFWTI